MCLLEEVLDWNEEGVRCRSTTHRAADNPLLAQGRLGAICGIEYAAQAMAVHAALVAGAAALQGGAAAPSVGYLVGLRGVRLGVLRLDDVAGDLICSAVRVAGNGSGALYEFELRSDVHMLLSGRATVLLDAGQRMKV